MGLLQICYNEKWIHPRVPFLLENINLVKRISPGLHDLSKYVPPSVRIPDEEDDDPTLLDFAKRYIVPRAKMIYNLMDGHVKFLHKRLPTIIKEARRKHAKVKGVDYQAFVAAGGIVYLIVDGVIAATTTVADILAASAAGGGLAAAAEGAVGGGLVAAAEGAAGGGLVAAAEGAAGGGLVAAAEGAAGGGLAAAAGATAEGAAVVGVEGAAEVAGEKVAETLVRKAGNAFIGGLKNAAKAAALGAAANAGTKVGELIKDNIQKIACDKFSKNLLGQKGGCPKKHVQEKMNHKKHV